MSGAEAPRPGDVARWVATLAAPELGFGDCEGRRLDKRERDRARGQLASWGLDMKGTPLPDVGEACGR